MKALRAASVLGVAHLAMACSISTSAALQPIEVQCSVDGAELVSAIGSPAGICAMFLTEMNKVLERETKLVNVASRSASERLMLDIRFTKPASASAIVTRNVDGKKQVYPEIAVDVMDKPLGQNEIKKLASEVAKLVAGAAWR